MSGGFTALGMPVGSTSGTVAAGDDNRLMQPSRAAVAASYAILSCRPIATSMTTGTFAKDNWRYMPTLLRTDLTVDALAVTTSSAASGGTAALIFGLFACDSSMRPSTRQADWSTYGSIDMTATAGVQTLATANLTIPAGEWWIGCAWTGTATGSPVLFVHLAVHPSVSSSTVVTNATAMNQSVTGGSVPATASPAAAALAGVAIYGKLH